MQHHTTLLVSVDGMRPDGILKADTPNMKRMIAEGASTLTARTVMPSITLPCHSSMIRGVDVPRHGITSNNFQPIARPVPSLLDVAHRGGKRTGFFFNWGELRDLCDPGSLDVGCFLQDAFRHEGDIRVADVAITQLLEHPFDLLFVYLGHTDESGHMHGWMTEEYLAAISNADKCIGRVLEACNSVGTTTSLVLSDHGGHGQSHGTEMSEDMTIPWILSGAKAKPCHQIATQVRIFDTTPTLAHLLGLSQAREWEGKIIEEALV